ncbi:Hypothetical protein PHPALM_16917 [Phytophthora palmivora]|uniref:Uncharacterized protein n=1 Tax=Phytophthora palmivora TaxID=4796 RepID=A0A2P4XNJ9_9STRA|nr:Hypothetical protein PHPALM_16917 [Phytophthora palmivora]
MERLSVCVAKTPHLWLGVHHAVVKRDCFALTSEQLFEALLDTDYALHLEIAEMKFFSCFAMVVLALTVASTNANDVEETGVKARHMLAMGDESIMFARGSLRREEETD